MLRIMKVYYKKHHIKNIPKRYEPVFDINIIDDLDSKRLSITERLNLEHKIILKSLSKYEFELIENSKPHKFVFTKSKEQKRLSILYENGVIIKCPECHEISSLSKKENPKKYSQLGMY